MTVTWLQGDLIYGAAAEGTVGLLDMGLTHAPVAIGDDAFLTIEIDVTAAGGAQGGVVQSVDPSVAYVHFRDLTTGYETSFASTGPSWVTWFGGVIDAQVDGGPASAIVRTFAPVTGGQTPGEGTYSLSGSTSQDLVTVEGVVAVASWAYAPAPAPELSAATMLLAMIGFIAGRATAKWRGW